ncbi:hypothetical protein ASD78_13290 [Lysobacter sp. Root667]|uniref:CopL family metal-binding regulatory protein n=1 Tax=Lysobacter sp. Root667 TaxID=1736581 RepID=UPI0006FBB98B|nr:CopL family metal-binding regulatory protein [Lysobacter sp. Root667]KRA74440.1 hypothetical protein ASD78_13290 [Lysobacter sp. Root667]
MSILLRLLLCVGLILNGSAYAVASTQMQLSHLSATMGAAAIAQTSCHDGMTDSGMTHDGMAHDGMHMAGMDHDGASMPAGHSGHAPDATSPDCCKSPTCTCSCLQPAPATAIAFALGGAHIGHAMIAQPMPVDHDAPALHSPIRPPIA